jgi:hypothetical protein
VWVALSAAPHGAAPAGLLELWLHGRLTQEATTVTVLYQARLRQR